MTTGPSGRPHGTQAATPPPRAQVKMGSYRAVYGNLPPAAVVAGKAQSRDPRDITPWGALHPTHPTHPPRRR